MRTGRRIVALAGWSLAGLAAVVAAYLLLVRPWHRGWGASKTEAARPMPADGLVIDPDFEATRAVTIEASQEEVWPWLVQMGRGRGGFYSWDLISRALRLQDGPSAKTLLPGVSPLRPGDEIAFGSGPGWPVTVVEPPTSLVIDIRTPDMRMTWSFLLTPLPDGKSRLLLRLRGRFEESSGPGPAGLILDPGEYVMVRRLMGGIKARAEGRPPAGLGEILAVGSWLVALAAALAAWIAAWIRPAWRRLMGLAWLCFLTAAFLALRQPAPAVSALLAAGAAALLPPALNRRGPGAPGPRP